MKTISLRGLDDELVTAVERRAHEDHASINATLLCLLREATALNRPKRHRVYSDLDHLAGTWSDEEKREFEQNTAEFEQIDEEMWQ